MLGHINIIKKYIEFCLKSAKSGFVFTFSALLSACFLQWTCNQWTDKRSVTKFEDNFTAGDRMWIHLKIPYQISSGTENQYVLISSI